MCGFWGRFCIFIIFYFFSFVGGYCYFLFVDERCRRRVVVRYRVRGGGTCSLGLFSRGFVFGGFCFVSRYFISVRVFCVMYRSYVLCRYIGVIRKF